MPPPPLLRTTMRTGALASRRAASPFESWKSPRSPVTIQVGAPVATQAPIPEEIRPSIPFAPRLERKRTSAGPGARNASGAGSDGIGNHHDHHQVDRFQNERERTRILGQP